jgi:hypothetical protein
MPMLRRLAIVFIVSAGCGHPLLQPLRPPDPAGCYAIVYERPDFQGAGDVLNGPARWPSLDRLTSTNQSNWRHRIRSLRLGLVATATAYTQTAFTGESQRFGPESAHPKLAPSLTGRIESLEVTCSK